MKRLKDIEDHLQRSDERYERLIKIEQIREQRKKRERVLKICVGLISILCALYAIAINL